MDTTTNMRPSVCFEVQKIIGISCNGNIRNYQVQWAPTWITDMQLVGCDHLIEEFFAEQPAKVQYGAEPTIVDETLDENFVNENINEQYNIVNDENFTNEEQLEDINEIDGNIEQETIVHVNSDEGVNEPCSMVLNDNTVINSTQSNVNKLLCSRMSTTVDFPITNPVNESDLNKIKNNGIVDIAVIKSEDSTEQMFTNEPSSSSFLLERLKSNDYTEQASTSEPSSSFLLDRLKSKDHTEPVVPSGSSSLSLLDRLKDDSNVSYITQCTICKIPFKSQGQLMNHVEIMHKMACLICGKKFPSRTDLVRHERIHSGEKPFQCDLCGKKYSRKETLRKHPCVYGGGGGSLKLIGDLPFKYEGFG